MQKHIENRTAEHCAAGSAFGLFFLACTSVLREGFETVLFLHAAYVQSSSSLQSVGAVIGVVIALSVSYLLFRGLMRISLSTLFTVTSVLLLFFAGGLLAHGIHELQEVGIIPFVQYPVWNTSSILSEKEGIGALLKGVFGYNANPSLIEVASYLLYMSGMSALWALRKRSLKS